MGGTEKVRNMTCNYIYIHAYDINIYIYIYTNDIIDGLQPCRNHEYDNDSYVYIYIIYVTCTLKNNASHILIAFFPASFSIYQLSVISQKPVDPCINRCPQNNAHKSDRPWGTLKGRFFIGKFHQKENLTTSKAFWGTIFRSPQWLTSTSEPKVGRGLTMPWTNDATGPEFRCQKNINSV